MSKVSEQQMKYIQEEFEKELLWNYQEWLRDHTQPTDGEIQQMEQDFKKKLSFIYNSSSISNNLYYDNPKGA